MWIKKLSIFCIFILGVMYYLSTKYVETGECAIIVYYIPMSWIDYVVITAIGIISILLSHFFARNETNQKWLLFEISIYSIVIILLCVLGNDILAMTEYNWPHNYNPAPYIESK